MNWIKTSVLACSVVCLGVGCSSDHSVNVGDGTAANVDKSKLESYQGNWDGYVEAYTFPSGTDRVRVTLDANGNGQLRVGDADLLPPPTDPDVPYPPAAGQPDPPRVDQLYDGIGYPIAGARIEAERIRFAVNTAATFSQWCGLQNSYAALGSYPLMYTCLPGGGGLCPTTSPDQCVPEPSVWDDQLGIYYYTCHGTESVDCGQVACIDCGKSVCSWACKCAESGCSANGTDVPLDAALSPDGHDLVGTILLEVGARTIRLKR
jgi:hypothetical protein